MEQSAIIQYIATTFAGVDTVTGTEGLAAGDSFFIYDPDHDLDDKQRFPFATIVTKDYGDFDRASNLDRPGVFRLNVGVSKGTFRALFGPPAGVTDAQYDFAALDQLMPHPVYAPQSWVSVLNPSEATFETIKPLLAEAYDSVVRRLTSARERRVRLTRDS
jgi:Family of unknown function (DUF6194)